jgi:hypothetical protein
MRTFILTSTFLVLVLVNIVKAEEEFFLECNPGQSYSYYNEKKNLVASVFKKQDRELHIYDWIHSNVKFTDKKITYKFKGFDQYKVYSSFERYNKTELDRYSGIKTFFKKDPFLLNDYFPEFVQKNVKLENIAWLFQFWEEEKTKLYCKKIILNNYKNIFVTEKYWNDNIKLKLYQDDNKFKKF